jgi:3-hydroxybutyryl-CoA dehydrogenase
MTHVVSSSGVSTLGIVGSGIMAAGIAEVAVVAGHTVTVRSRSAAGANDVSTRVAANLARRVERGKLDADVRDASMHRLTTTTELAESVVEDLEAKVALFQELDALAAATTILATNTSTLSVETLARTTGRADRVCGIHFFNPAVTMPLVEVVRPECASGETVDAAMAFVSSCGKEAVLVRDDAGFVVNALLFPYLNDAIKMLERGTASMDDIDSAMKGGCNFPMGPFALLDLVGLDTALAIIRTLHEASGNPADAPAETLVRLVADGNLGRKTGRGFRSH